MSLSRIEDAIAAIGRGEMVVVVDDAARENEGDLILAAEKVTAEKLAFLIRHTSGVVCAALTAARLDQLQLPLMVAENTDPHRTAFTVTVDLARGPAPVSRPRIARLRCAPSPIPARRPPTSFGQATSSRCAPATAACSSGAGTPRRRSTWRGWRACRPCGVLCEVVNDDGSMTRGRRSWRRSRDDHGLHLISIADLVAYRRRTEPLVEAVAEARLPTPHGQFAAHVYRDRHGRNTWRW